MLAIPKRLSDALKQPDTAGAVKVGIQAFDWPDRTADISESAFNWKTVGPVLDLYNPIQAVSPSDGSVVVLDTNLIPGKVDDPPIVSGVIKYVKVTNGGSGYTDDPVISFTDQAGSGAVLTPNIVGNVVSSVTITNGGSGYIDAPAIRVNTVTGSGGTITLPSLTAVLTNGVITDVTIVSPGANIATLTLVVGAIQPCARAVVQSGIITGIYILTTRPADYPIGVLAGYNTGFHSFPDLPTVTITSTTGSNATAIVSSHNTDCVPTQTTQDNLVIDSGDSSYPGTPPSIEIMITTVGAQDKFKWRNVTAGGAWSAEVTCDLTTTLITIDGDAQLYVHFAAITGHKLNDLWYITWPYYTKANYATFVPSNLNDISFSGHLTETIIDSEDNLPFAAGTTIHVTITTVGATDKFQWYDSVNNTVSAEIECSATPILLSKGIYVAFAAVTGHTLYDSWVSTLTADYGNYIIRRFVNSGTTSFTPVQTPATPVTFSCNCNQSTSTKKNRTHTVAIVANNATAEVVILAWIYSSSRNYLQAKVSTDYGVTWGAWTTIYSDAATPDVEGNIAVGMNAAGDMGVLSHQGYHLAATVGVTNSVPLIRTSGSWATQSLITVLPTTKQLAYDTTFGWYIFNPYSLTNIAGVTQAVDSTPSKTTSMDLTTFIRNQQLDYKYTDPVISYTLNMQYQKFIGYQNSTSPWWDSYGKWQNWTTVTPVYKTVDQYAKEVVSYGTYTSAALGGAGWWIMPEEDKFIVISGTTSYVYYKDGIAKAQKNRHTSCVSDGVLAGNSDYCVLFFPHYIRYSDYPYDWEPSVVPGVPGTELLFDSDRILSVTEYVRESESSIVVMFDNYDGYFDTAGSGALSVFKTGNRINFYAGCQINGTDEVIEHQRYYIQQFEETRFPNIRVFTVIGIGGEWRFNNYQFPRQKLYNEVLETGVENNETTAYGIVDALIKSIGGTLDYKSRSTAMTSYYPPIVISAGKTPSQIWSPIDSVTEDKLIFFGVDATMINPTTSDPATHHYRFPQELLKKGGFNKFAFNTQPFNGVEEEYDLTLFEPMMKQASLGINHVFISGTEYQATYATSAEAQDADLEPEILFTANVGTMKSWETLQQRADTILANAKRMQNRGQFTAVFNPSMQIWDVVNIIDPDCNQANNYRVSGWVGIYQPYLSGLQDAKYEMIIQLTSV